MKALRKPARLLKKLGYNWLEDGIDNQITRQIEEFLDFSRQFRHLFGKPKQAYNVDAFDETTNSSWFTNRNHIKQMPLKEIARGPDTGTGPDTTGKRIITRAKVEGITPGFTIKDKHGNYYVIKFDPIGFNEMATGAEVVSTKLLYAAGYFTPENYITYFHPLILKIDDNVKFTDHLGKKRNMTMPDIERLLSKVEILSSGYIRATASKYIQGKPKGPFAYCGTRKDDPKDFVPHQHRRELRGFKAIAAWLHHNDTKSGNSFDSRVA